MTHKINLGRLSPILELFMLDFKLLRAIDWFSVFLPSSMDELTWWTQILAQ